MQEVAEHGGLNHFVPANMRSEPLARASCPPFILVQLASGLTALVVLGLSPQLPGKPDLIIIVALGWLGLQAILSGFMSWAALRDSEERYRLVADNASDMITRHDRDGRVTFVSGAARQLAATQPELLMGDGLAERIHEDDLYAYRQALQAASSSDRPVSVELRLGAGKRRWVEMTCRPLLAERPRSGTAETIVAVTRDIAEHKYQEEALRQARTEAEQANQLKSHFLASISHELRTPLHSVIGFSEVLAQRLRQTGSGAAESEYVGLIHDSGQQLLRIVNDLLDLSRIEAGKYRIVPESLDMAEIATQCGRMMQATAQERNVRLIVGAARDGEKRRPMDIVADRRACKQILINLMANAITFSRDGGEVRVTVEEEGDEVVVTVADRGIGISADLLARLGTPFVLAGDNDRSRQGGPGLGLPVTKGLVDLHGGRLDIASREGEGTQASVRLPRRMAAEGTPADDRGLREATR